MPGTSFVPEQHAFIFKNQWHPRDDDIPKIRAILESQLEEIVIGLDAAIRSTLSTALTGSPGLGFIDASVTKIVPTLRARITEEIIGPLAPDPMGLCGGMAFAGLDYFAAGIPIPPLTTQPEPDGPFKAWRDLIWRRLTDSVQLNGKTFTDWTVTLNLVPVGTAVILTIIDGAVNAAASAVDDGDWLSDVPVVGAVLDDVVSFVRDNAGDIVKKIGQIATIAGKSIDDVLGEIPLNLGPALFPGLAISGAVLATGGFTLQFLGQSVQVDAGGRREIARRTHAEWGVIKQAIDAGETVPIGLFTNSLVFTDHHQVVAFGYESNTDGPIDLLIWDNNKGNIVTRLPFRASEGQVEIDYDVAAHPAVGFFRETYKAQSDLPMYPRSAVCLSGASAALATLDRYPQQEEVFWVGADRDVSSTWRNDDVDGGRWHPQFAIAAADSVRAGSRLVTLARSPQQEEIFWVGANGDVSSTWRNDTIDGGKWQQPFAIAVPGSVRGDSPLAVLSRIPQQEEVFWIGANGDISSNWRNDTIDGGRWHPQFGIAPPGSVRPDSPLLVFARSPRQEEVFWIGATGDVSSTWRNDDVDGGKWYPPFGIARPDSVRLDSPLALLVRDDQQEEVFWIGTNGDVSSTWRNDGVDGGKWQQQFAIANPNSVRAGSPLVVLARTPQQEEVFWIGANGDVSSAWRNDGIDGGKWHPQFAIAAPSSARPDSPLVVLSRDPQHEEVFWIGVNGDVSSTWRNDTVDGGSWHPQFGIATPGSARPKSPLVILARKPQQEEAFWVGANGDVSSTWRDDGVDGGTWHPQFGIAMPGSVVAGT